VYPVIVSDTIGMRQYRSPELLIFCRNSRQIPEIPGFRWSWGSSRYYLAFPKITFTCILLFMTLTSDRPLLCFAHRGASGHEPENTLRSFSKAISLGAPWIEFDVRAVENEAIIFHDRTLTRCAKRLGLIDQQSLAKIRSYDVGKGERIPLLSEVLTLLVGKAKAQVELKGLGSASVAAREIRKALAEGWRPDDFLVSSFDQSELALFKNELPHVPRGLLVYGYPITLREMAKTFEPVSIHLHIDSVSRERIAEMQGLGFKVYVYTVNEPSDIETVRDMGADGVFSNYPERVLGLTKG
jgi:glycerophosphoryl diester phosphodiesterase